MGGQRVVAATLAVDQPVRHHEWVDLDDHAGILFNPELHVGSLREALVVSFTKPVLSVPLTTLSLQLGRALYGDDPTGTLVTHVALHAAAAIRARLPFLRGEVPSGASAAPAR